MNRCGHAPASSPFFSLFAFVFLRSCSVLVLVHRYSLYIYKQSKEYFALEAEQIALQFCASFAMIDVGRSRVLVMVNMVSAALVNIVCVSSQRYERHTSCCR
jgi:hypothetical protein